MVSRDLHGWPRTQVAAFSGLVFQFDLALQVPLPGDLAVRVPQPQSVFSFLHGGRVASANLGRLSLVPGARNPGDQNATRYGQRNSQQDP